MTEAQLQDGLRLWDELRARPIPDLAPLPDLSGVGIDLKDPRASEGLVEAKRHGLAGENHYYSEWTPPYYHMAPGSIPDLLLREGVVRKLIRVNSLLHRMGLELYLFDAYRPIDVQNYFFREWIPAFLCRENPERDEAWVKAETSRYWTEASDEPSSLLLAPPPHSTGGAVDLTIRRIGGYPREMGTMFDDITERSWPNYFEQHGAMGFTEREAMFNRRLLFHAMTEEGFAYHPLEWWHFSYGDRLWGALNKSQAFYGYLPLVRRDL